MIDERPAARGYCPGEVGGVVDPAEGGQPGVGKAGVDSPALALLAVLAPWLYAPTEPRARLLYFSIATLVAAALCVRAYMTAT